MLGRLKSHLDKYDAEQMGKNQAAAFARAKQISDFVGMFVRLALCSAFFHFCLDRAQDGSSFWPAKWAFGLSAMYALGTMTLFWSQITKIILNYFLLDVTKSPHVLWRGIFLVLSLFSYLCVTYCLWKAIIALGAVTKVK